MAKKRSRGSGSPQNDQGRVEETVAPDMRVTRQDQSDRTLQARTVLYVHGIGNKPAESILRGQWDNALFGQPMGDRTRMAYWVNRQRYPEELAAARGDPDLTEAGRVGGYAAYGGGFPELSDQEFIAALDNDSETRRWLQELNALLVPEEPQPEPTGARVSGVNWLVGRPLATALFWFRRWLLPDVYDFFFDQERRDTMLQTVARRLGTGGGPFIVIGHSQGSMIAYEYLRQLSRSDCHVALFLTIGSPLGLPPVRDRFRQWTKQRSLPFPACVDRWVNVANWGDPVCLDSDLSDDLDLHAKSAAQSFENFVVRSPNEDLQRDRHAATGYLKTEPVQLEVRALTGSDFVQPFGFQVIASDLVEQAERSLDARSPCLIELQVDRDALPGLSVRDLAEELKAKILEMTGEDESSLQLEVLRHYVAVKLTCSELEKLRTLYADLNIHRIWRDAEKRALIDVSSVTIQACAANRAYQAEGAGINWAVLDTGIDASHPHFQQHRNVKQVWDCTGLGVQPVPLNGPNIDRHGHGTHVAGIIAGEYRYVPEQARPARLMAGMAPRAGLIGFKVLDDRGVGQDSSIIKALDKIVEMNESAGQMVVHGVNLSLGGDFDPSSYGCGHTPLCNELRRLWRQGLMIVIAAGNEGFDILRRATGQPRLTNLDISIMDPANLEEAIAVGSVHRKRPHSFGISFFSSCGPTADGRQKPDLVAPGERIVSANTSWPSFQGRPLYVEASGTSMAAPHVSGVLAAFLSVRKEFLGNPDHVKAILLRNCTDLGRDRYLQGAGMPNLVRMLAGT